MFVLHCEDAKTNSIPYSCETQTHHYTHALIRVPLELVLEMQHSSYTVRA